jgi:AraC-like DNA-binding protein
MLSHPGMRFRAGFEGKGFNDRCISLIYHAAEDERFDAARTWARPERRVLRASNRLYYLRWLLQRAATERAPMLAEYAASEIFHEPGKASALVRPKTLAWYAARIHAARERLDAEFDSDHTASALARSVGMSAFRFTRVFTELVGRPPHRYLTERRLMAAREMLIQGRSVTETCFACGFNNLSHFSRSFTRRFGASPSRIIREDWQKSASARRRA